MAQFGGVTIYNKEFDTNGAHNDTTYQILQQSYSLNTSPLIESTRYAALSSTSPRLRNQVLRWQIAYASVPW